MITFKHTGNFKLTEKFMKGAIKHNPRPTLIKYGRKGVLVLAAETPKDTGETANSWDYKLISTKDGYSLEWTNSNAEFGVPVVILIQYGHGTGNGAYVQGRDFINPALKPILDQLAEDLTKEVFSL
jgi:hypothetical protein